MPIEVRCVDSAGASECYICATPTAAAEAPTRLFRLAMDAALAHGGRIAQERIFAPREHLGAWQAARVQAYGPDADNIPADWLVAGDPAAGGVQLHCIRGAGGWSALTSGARTVGWTFSHQNTRWAFTTGLRAPSAGDQPAQAHAAFETAASVLSQAGMGLKNLARTWIFMHRILDWYGTFNKVRNDLFLRAGMLAPGDASLVPASTGMGVSPTDGSAISIECCAIDGTAIQRLPAAGKQRCAYEYGSAFARASIIPTPAATTLFVSGTAAIDHDGKTLFVGDAPRQIDNTLGNVDAVLATARFDTKHTVQAIAYCKTPEVAEIFRRDFAPRQQWPWLIVIGDVCRDDLLFEAEVTAAMPRG